MRHAFFLSKKPSPTQQVEGVECKHDTITKTSGQGQPVTVLFDGACPLCSREISLYKRLEPNKPLCFADVSDPMQALPDGMSRTQVLARFHVIGIDGQVLSGAQAFLALWSTLPGWRWLALAGRFPGARWIMECSYRTFLHLRPSLQRLFVRLDQNDRQP